VCGRKGEGGSWVSPPYRSINSPLAPPFHTRKFTHPPTHPRTHLAHAHARAHAHDLRQATYGECVCPSYRTRTRMLSGYVDGGAGGRVGGWVSLCVWKQGGFGGWLSVFVLPRVCLSFLSDTWHIRMSRAAGRVCALMLVRGLSECVDGYRH